jgi:hypothetical protein
MATALQYPPAALVARLPTTSVRGRALANYTDPVWLSAGHAGASTTTAPELTFHLDHRLGAGHDVDAERLRGLLLIRSRLRCVVMA